MLIKYYKNPQLAYTNRKRYGRFSFVPDYQETQKSILLGDGAQTSIKTRASNICDYVTIDDTRWFVTSYVYLNGGQVRLNLQRDVIGEFGINDCFGKIERGYTNSILKNRKELNLNQILKKRQKLIPNSNIYGNYSVNNHENELWGVLYLTKPSEINPNTGEPYPEQVNINIPAFQPVITNYEPIENGFTIDYQSVDNCKIDFIVSFRNTTTKYKIEINFRRDTLYSFYPVIVNVNSVGSSSNYDIIIDEGLSNSYDWSGYESICYEIGHRIGSYILTNNSSSNGYKFPVVPTMNSNYTDYNNIIIKVDDEFRKYTMEETLREVYGVTGSKLTIYQNLIYPAIQNTLIEVQQDWHDESEYVRIHLPNDNNYSSFSSMNILNSWTIMSKTYNYTVLSESESGVFTIDVSQQLIDEPYVILVCPLFDVDIIGNGSSYSIKKETSFMVFNTIIQYLSGENAYLVDAQVYPYCPILTNVSTEVAGIPFFSINSTNYNHNIEIQLLPYSDVKKEYIQREYSIISPEQSSKVNFNFYDYINTIEDDNGINYAKMNIIIKTALKPFSIIASAVIQPELNTLINITYSSDLRGSQPSSNGFECSLATNQFEQYKRQNSNYQQFFNLDKQELQKQHQVELVNDITSTIINTTSATAMGAMAGNAMGEAGIWGEIVGSEAIGAGVGAGVAGGLVGGAMATQTIMNSQLRDYEEYLQAQRFDLTIGTIKNLPNSVNRISSFNEIILQDFWFIVETYECSEYEKVIVDNFINNYGYAIGVFDYIVNYYKRGWFLKSTLISSNYAVNLHLIAEKELMGGIYYYEQI